MSASYHVAKISLACLFSNRFGIKFGQLILRKIIKIVATRCHILRLKCTEFDFGWDFTGEALPQASYMDLRCPKIKERMEGREGKAFPLSLCFDDVTRHRL